MIIASFKNEIDPTIKPQVELIQQMIKEFFEDNLENGLDDEKKEKMNIIFNKADVYFDQLKGSVNRKSKLFI